MAARGARGPKSVARCWACLLRAGEVWLYNLEVPGILESHPQWPVRECMLEGTRGLGVGGGHDHERVKGERLVGGVRTDPRPRLKFPSEPEWLSVPPPPHLPVMKTL